MEAGSLAIVALGIAALVIAAVVLHRVALRLEAAGYLYYRDRKPTPGGVPAFFPLQEIVEPQIEYQRDVQNHLPETSSDERHLPDRFDPKRPERSTRTGDDSSSS